MRSERARSSVGKILVGTIASVVMPIAGSAQVQERMLPETDQRIDLEIEELFTRGTIAGDTWEAFGQIREVDFGLDGSLYILDQQASLVLRVSPDGEYLGSIGRQGDGPGELSLPTALLVAPDGRVWVRDTRRSTWAIFESDGTYVDNVSFDGSRGVPSTIRVASDGSIAAMPNELTMRQGGEVTRSYMVQGGASPGNVERIPLLTFDPEGTNPRVLHEVWKADRMRISGGTLLEMAFVGQTHFDLLPDGRVVVVDSLDWRLRLVAGHLGLADQVLTRPVPPQPVTERIQELEVERRSVLANQGRSGGALVIGGSLEGDGDRMPRAMEQRLRSGLGFPEVRQVIRGLEVDSRGRIWIARTPESLDPDAPGPVDVLDASGRYLGTVPEMTLPDAFGPDGLAVWVGEGEFEVPVVTVRRVRLGGARSTGPRSRPRP